MGIRIYDPAYSPDQPIAVVRDGLPGDLIAERAQEIGGYEISVEDVRDILEEYESHGETKEELEFVQGELESIRKWIEGRDDDESLMFFMT